LPLFLLWLQISWLVILFGAEISFAHQNVETYEFEPDCLASNQAFKRQLALLITTKLVKDLSDGQPAATAEKISHTLEIPIRLVRLILFELVEGKVLSEVKQNDDKDSAYQPAVDINKLTIQYVVDALEKRGNAYVPINETDELKKIKNSLKTFKNEFKNSHLNLLLKEI
jgi:membrane protein